MLVLGTSQGFNVFRIFFSSLNCVTYEGFLCGSRPKGAAAAAADDESNGSVEMPVEVSLDVEALHCYAINTCSSDTPSILSSVCGCVSVCCLGRASCRGSNTHSTCCGEFHWRSPKW